MENENLPIITLQDYIGQNQIISDLKERIKIPLEDGIAIDHLLFCGPCDIGKQTLVNALGNFINRNIKFVRVNGVIKQADLAGLLTSLEVGDILAIEDFKGLKKNISELLYQAITTQTIDIMIETGSAARAINLILNPFTLVLLATKPWEIEERFRRWFLVYDFASYSLENLTDILLKIADKEEIKIEVNAAQVLASYCNGKPGNAEVILKRIIKTSKYSNTAINDENILEIINQLGYGKSYPKSLTLADKFSQMTGIEFEHWVADHFRKQGFEVKETKTTGDHGIDLFLYQSNTLCAVVQCKCWDGTIGEPTIREFYGSLVNSKAPLGYVFASSSFTQQAINFSNDKPIKLVDLEALVQLENN